MKVKPWIQEFDLDCNGIVNDDDSDGYLECGQLSEGIYSATLKPIISDRIREGLSPQNRTYSDLWPTIFGLSSGRDQKRWRGVSCYFRRLYEKEKVCWYSSTPMPQLNRSRSIMLGSILLRSR